MNSRSTIFRRGAVAYGVDTESEFNFKQVWSKMARLQNEENELTIAFKMPSNGHFYIALTAHAP